jgi:hypothetical protein
MELVGGGHRRRGRAAVPDALHEALRALVAEMIGAVAGTRPPGSHVSLVALGAGRQQATELAAMLRALFAGRLSDQDVLRSPTPDALARTIEVAWFDAGGTVAELAERVAALAEDE